MEKILLACIAILVANPCSSSSLIEIGNLGETKLIHDHYIKNKKRPNKPEKMSSMEDWYKSMLPIRSKTLSPGYVKTEKRSPNGLQQPIFLFGYDKKSFDWVQSNKKALLDMKAVGVLVNVQSIEELKNIGLIMQGLNFTLSSGDDIAQLLKVTNYPVLITKNGISQ